MSAARRPLAKFDGRVLSYVVRDLCPTEESRHIFHSWVLGQPSNPLQRLSSDKLPFWDHRQQQHVREGLDHHNFLDDFISSLQRVKVDNEHHLTIRVPVAIPGVTRRFKPFHRPATDPTAKIRQRKTKTEKNGERARTWSSRFTRSFPPTGPQAKSFRKCQKREFQTRIFLSRPTLWFSLEQLQKGGMSPSKRRRD